MISSVNWTHFDIYRHASLYYRTFSNKPCQSLHTTKRRQLFLEAEKDFWMIMVNFWILPFRIQLLVQLLGKENLKPILKPYVTAFKKRSKTIYSFDFLDSYNSLHGEDKGWTVCAWIPWRGGTGSCIWGHSTTSLQDVSGMRPFYK